MLSLAFTVSASGTDQVKTECSVSYTTQEFQAVPAVDASTTIIYQAAPGVGVVSITPVQYQEVLPYGNSVDAAVMITTAEAELHASRNLARPIIWLFSPPKDIRLCGKLSPHRNHRPGQGIV